MEDGGVWSRQFAKTISTSGSLVAATRLCHFPAYIFLSHFIPPLSSWAWFVGNYSMADVSDSSIQEGSFSNNVAALW